MNLNHDPDKHLLDQIDKLLETHQPTGDKVLDELATLHPTPRPVFQNALEQHLLAHLEHVKQGESPMVTATSYLPIPVPRRNWLPLTQIAALLVVAIAGVILINGRGKPSTPNEIALAAETGTATPAIPTITIAPPVVSQNLRIPGVGGVAPVVIAARDIPQGTVLGSAWLETVYWADDSGSTQTYTDISVLRGLIAKQDIPRWQPIIPAYLADQPVSTFQPTDIPSPLVNVVVAFQNLPRGYTFSDRDLSNAAGYAGWPANTVPTDAIRDNGTSNITNLYGKILKINVSRGEPILTSMLSEDFSGIISNAVNILPSDRIAVELPRTLFTSDNIQPVEGDIVNIVALLPYSGNRVGEGIPVTFMPPNSAQVISSRIVSDALVVFIGTWPRPDSTKVPSDQAGITFAVPPEQAGLLTWLATQPITLKLELVKSADTQPHLLSMTTQTASSLSTALPPPTIEQTPTPTPRPTLPFGKVEVDIPKANTAPLAEGMKLIAGSTHVDVIATFLSIDTGAPAKLQSLVTLQPGQTPDELTQRVVRAALVINTGDVYTLAVSPDEAATLQWLMDAKIPMTLRPVAPSAELPTHAINLKLDSVSHWASDNLQVGDSADVVLGMVLGFGQNPQLGFKPYGQYSFNDALTSGLITAQTYVQADSTAAAALFVRRAVQNATIIAISVHKDPKSGRTASFTLALELSADTTVDQSDFLASYVATGMPFLVIKH